MIKKNPGEVWKQIIFTGHKQLRKKYAVSSHGRAASYNDDVVMARFIFTGKLQNIFAKNLHQNINM